MTSSAEAERRRAAAIVVAGGSGRRMGGEVPKQYLPLLGEPVLLHAVRAFVGHPAIDDVVVVLPADDAADPPEWLVALPLTVVAGGAERGDSVRAGLASVPEAAETVLVHDGARPLVSRAVIDRVLAAAREGGAVAAVPVTDTVQEVGPTGTILSTPDRSRLRAAQTPQGFPRAELAEAYRRALRDGFAATDDAAVYARYAGPVRVVEGAPENLKVTRPGDLEVAAVLARRLLRGGEEGY